jgi:hypothetical protein
MADEKYKARYRGVSGTGRLIYQAAKHKLRGKSGRSARDVPLGSGSAEEASKRISGRQRQIDKAVEEAERGSLASARRPRSY